MLSSVHGQNQKVSVGLSRLLGTVTVWKIQESPVGSGNPMAPNCALKLPLCVCNTDAVGTSAPPAVQQSSVPLSNPLFESVFVTHVAGVVPRPVRLAVRGPPGPLSVTVSMPGLTPDAVGWKLTLITQLLLAASELPQLLFCR